MVVDLSYYLEKRPIFHITIASIHEDGGIYNPAGRSGFVLDKADQYPSVI
jgi:hypothetical protein